MNESVTAPQVERQLDPDNPWPGLQAFEENARDYFHGRDAEAEELVRRVIGAPLTVLFGKSGLGKTSLLKAGLFPRLREKRFLPVYVRLDIRRDAPPLAEQLRDALRATCESERVDAPAFTDGETLWEYLHRSSLELWSAENYQLTPVLVVDQFEEQFTLGERLPEAVDRFRIDLGDLIENRIPAAVAALLEAKAAEVERLDLRAMPYKIIVSLREDFLPDLEAWRREIPSLGRVRVRLLPMRPEQALSAVYDTAPHLMDEATARRIVAFVAAAQATGAEPAAGDVAPSGEIEPALLSLFCRGLNEQRKRQGKPRFDAALLDGAGQSIISDYYASCVENLPDAARRFIETELITEKGFRNSYAKEDAVPGRLTKEQLDHLIQRRLLRVEERYGAERIELTHDLLTRAVREHRDRRRASEKEREREEETRQQQERVRAEWEARRQRTRTQFFTGAALVCSGFAAVAGYMWWKASTARDEAHEAANRALAAEGVATTFRKAAEEKAKEQTELRKTAEDAKALATSAAARAEEQALLALGGKVASQSTVFVNPAVNIPLDTAALLALASDRLRPSMESQGSLLVPLNRLASARKLIVSPTGLNGVAFDPSGKRLVSAGDDGTLRLWDVATGQPVGQPLEGHKDRAWAVAFSPDGRMLVSGDTGGTVIFWDAVTRTVLGRGEQGHNNWVNRVAFSPDGKNVASVSDDKQLILWDAVTREPRVDRHSGTTGLNAVAFSPDGRTLVTGGANGAIRLWDVDQLKQPKWDKATTSRKAALSIAFSPDGKTIVSGHEDGSLAFWDVAEGELKGQYAGAHRDWIYDVAFSKDGNTLVSVSKDETIVLWKSRDRVPSGEPLRVHKDEVRSVAFSADGKSFVSASSDNALIVWDVAAPHPIRERLGQHKGGDRVSSAAFNPHSGGLVTGSLDGTLLLWDVRQRKLRVGWEPTSDAQPVQSLAFSRDGKTIASVHGYPQGPGAIRLWDAATLQPSRERSSATIEEPVVSVAFSPDGKTIATGGREGTLLLWNASTLQPSAAGPLRGHKGAVWTVAFSPDGKTIASGGEDAKVLLWATQRPKLIGEPLKKHERGVFAVAFSPDGNVIASGGNDRVLILWDAATRQVRGFPLRAHKGLATDAYGITGLAFSRNGKMVASVGGDGTLILWDAGGQLPFDPLKGSSRLFAVSFSPDGKTVATGDDDGIVMLWDVDPESWRRKLCAKLTRNLSQSEWDTYVGKSVPYQEQCPGLPKSGT